MQNESNNDRQVGIVFTLVFQKKKRKHKTVVKNVHPSYHILQLLSTSIPNYCRFSSTRGTATTSECTMWSCFGKQQV